MTRPDLALISLNIHTITAGGCLTLDIRFEVHQAHIQLQGNRVSSLEPSVPMPGPYHYVSAAPEFRRKNSYGDEYFGQPTAFLGNSKGARQFSDLEIELASSFLLDLAPLDAR
ncbi:hypothetical protein AVEN_180015-1 [Araneus ventricosus]|uniref:Uncharacterized protein n=1 Tax=Araneus ventricosus TaxID=182803 RepID=A0A4Y2GVH7_ARAVE|nr:hypothetical protein AVEN_180015-1 [Araneus ventricosus]